MDSTLINIGGHGLGDCILSLQISSCLKEKTIQHINLISTRDQVYNPLWHIFGNEFDMQKIDEGYSENNNIISDHRLQKELELKYNSNYITYNVPDLLFKHPLAFKYEEYGLSLNTIRRKRTLLKHFRNKEKIIYCGLCSPQKDHIYKNIPSLLRTLAEYLPDYTIYFPYIKKWNRDITDLGDFNIDFPSNVFIHNEPEFKDSLDYLVKSSYGIFTDNGPSHIAYHIGMPRLILDPKFNNILWMARWKDDPEECVSIDADKNEIAQIVYHNIRTPQTTLIDRKIIKNYINAGSVNWKDILLFKY